MSETWIPWAERRTPSAGGENKEGYWGIPARALDLIEFLVNHSGEGWLTFLLQFHRPGANASWGLVGARRGTLYQGRPLESIPWTSGGPQNNIRGLAIEWEGKGSAMPLTPEQVATGRRLYEWTKPRLPNMGAPVLGRGFREHSELTNGATTCPSGRIQPLYDSYEEDEVTDAELRKAIKEETWKVVLELLRLGTTGDKAVPMKQWSDKVLSGLADLKSKLDTHDHH